MFYKKSANLIGSSILNNEEQRSLLLFTEHDGEYSNCFSTHSTKGLRCKTCNSMFLLSQKIKTNCFLKEQRKPDSGLLSD